MFSFVIFGVLLLTFLNCVQTAINYKNLEIQPTCEVLFGFSCFMDEIEAVAAT